MLSVPCLYNSNPAGYPPHPIICFECCVPYLSKFLQRESSGSLPCQKVKKNKTLGYNMIPISLSRGDHDACMCEIERQMPCIKETNKNAFL